MPNVGSVPQVWVGSEVGADGFMNAVYGLQSRPPKPVSAGLSDTPTSSSAISASCWVSDAGEIGCEERDGGTAGVAGQLVTCQRRRTDEAILSPQANGSPASPTVVHRPVAGRVKMAVSAPSWNSSTTAAGAPFAGRKLTAAHSSPPALAASAWSAATLPTSVSGMWRNAAYKLRRYCRCAAVRVMLRAVAG